MPSLHHKTRVFSESFRKGIDKLLTCPEVVGRVKAITSLQDQARSSFDLSRELITFAYIAVSPGQGRPALLDRYWAMGTGKTWKALSEFPNRLEKIAAEVKRINSADPLFHARRRGNDLCRDALLELQQACMQLPTMMRDYAEALRERNAAVSLATPRSGNSNAICQLTDIVKFLTGTYHDQEVSELLNAVADVLGEKKQFEAINIAQVRSRRRRRAHRHNREE